uniref:Uncharacterized protein n=1 Tax=Hordeum vulgare subsp. vulgare TaxID=112509 RepID=A0A8I7BC51_HORVV
MPRNEIASTVSGGVMLPKDFLSPKHRRDQPLGSGTVHGGEPYLRPHTAQQATSSSESSARFPSAAEKTVAQVNSKKTKELEEADKEICRLNELGLGDTVSHEGYLVHLKQLPRKPDVDTSTELDAVQLKELNDCHASYRLKYYYHYQLSQHVPEDKLCYDKLKENYPAGHRPMGQRSFMCLEEDGELDWSFHLDYCKLAGLEDYQRLVPRNYGGFEYANWDEYHKDCHSYEIEQGYVKYCEALPNKLKWIEAYVLNKPPSLMWGKILTRGTYQAIKIATDFSEIYEGLAFSGFYEWLDSMGFDVCCYNEFDGLYYEIWQRYTVEKNFRDALYEVYELNMFPLRHERMRRALENDTFSSDLEEEFLACTACLEEFAEDKSLITEDKARELIAEALRKETQKLKFYEDYCRKKIDIAQAIGLISSIPS